jgi:hypothetical protein
MAETKQDSRSEESGSGLLLSEKPGTVGHAVNVSGELCMGPSHSICHYHTPLVDTVKHLGGEVWRGATPPNPKKFF